MFTAKASSLGFTQMLGMAIALTQASLVKFITLGERKQEKKKPSFDYHINFNLVSFCRSRTCSQTMPGSLGHEEQDAKTFASWVEFNSV